MRVFFFFPHAFAPPRAGCHHRALQTLGALLGAGHRVTVGGARGDRLYPWTAEAADALQALGASGLHLYEAGSRLAASDWLDDCLHREGADALWMNYASEDRFVSHEGIRARGLLTVIDIHDLATLNAAMQRRLAADEADRAVWLRDDYARRFTVDTAALEPELAVYRRYQRVLCLAPSEAELLGRLLPHQQVVHLPQTFAPVPSANAYDAPPLFAAALNPFNRQGYEWLAERVLPGCPGLRIEVFGNVCEELAPRPGLVLRGFVPELAPHYARGAFAVCPLLSGTGQKIKIVEAMAHGLAVVATRQSGADTPIVHGETGFLADTAEEMAAALRRLAADRALCRRLGQAARAEVSRAWGPARSDAIVTALLGGRGVDAPTIFTERLRTRPAPPAGARGRGIVTCAGGTRYFPSGWVLVRRLRELGCALPIEWWHLGREEMSPQMIRLLERYGVTCIDAYPAARALGMHRLCGFSMKFLAIARSAFAEVLFLDADNAPVRDPTFLFDEPSYRATGVLLWPDRWRGRAMGGRYRTINDAVYRHLDMAPLDEPEAESGQLLVDKERAWRALDLALSMNQHGDFWYRFIHGDKDTLRLCLRRIGQPFSMVPRSCAWPNDRIIYQHAPDGRLLFQHRCGYKWLFREPNPTPPGFVDQPACERHVAELARLWDGRVRRPEDGGTPDENDAFDRVTAQRWFHYQRVGHDARVLELLPSGGIGEGRLALEEAWHVSEDLHGVGLSLLGQGGVTCVLHERDRNRWEGRWRRFERMPIILQPAARAL